MKVTARGWSRDHGERVLLEAELVLESVTEDLKTFHKGETYFEVKREVHQWGHGRRKVGYTVRVSAHADLNLNGSYLMQLRLNRNEVARLFYLTNGDRGLPELLEIFSTFKAREIVGLPTKQAETPVVQESTIEEAAVGTVAQATAFNPVFLKKVDQLEFSVRTSMCLKNENIVYIGDLVKETEASMLRVPNLGRKSLNEIKEALVQLDLHLGIEIPGWPPENVAELAERFRND